MEERIKSTKAHQPCILVTKKKKDKKKKEDKKEKKKKKGVSRTSLLFPFLKGINRDTCRFTSPTFFLIKSNKTTVK